MWENNWFIVLFHEKGEKFVGMYISMDLGIQVKSSIIGSTFKNLISKSIVVGSIILK